MRVVVEQSAPEAETVARLVAAEGHDVRVADLEVDSEPADVAYLDVWTPETAARVSALRERGASITCSSELVLRRARRAGARTVGITGTAGKSTTASLAVQLLHGAGISAHASKHARLGHLWAADDLVADLDLLVPGDVVVLELTSSHLAFMSSSPDVAVITSFWPDHLELHGSAAAYRAAKETIVRHQRPDGAVVVNADDPAVRSFADLTPARRYAFSATGEVHEGAFARDGTAIARRGGRDVELGPLTSSAPLALATLGACAAALAAGTDPERLAGGLEFLKPPPHRQETLGLLGGALVVDDGMAATPSKARAALTVCPDASVVLIAGGRLQTDGGDAHASPQERALLGAFCDEAARTVRLAVLFGEAADRLECKLVPRGVDTRTVRTLEEAVPVALAASPGAQVVLFAPVYPLSIEEREAFPGLVREAAGADLVRDSRP
jgi:UDP-N-acetylmuramoylalanine--D-glutamate ligase